MACVQQLVCLHHAWTCATVPKPVAASVPEPRRSSLTIASRDFGLSRCQGALAALAVRWIRAPHALAQLVPKRAGLVRQQDSNQMFSLYGSHGYQRARRLRSRVSHYLGEACTDRMAARKFQADISNFRAVFAGRGATPTIYPNR